MQAAQNIRTTIRQSAAGFTKVRPWDIWFCESPDKYVQEFRTVFAIWIHSSRNLRWP